MLLLTAMQFGAAKVASRLAKARKLLTAEPTLLLLGGTVIEAALKSQRVSAEQLTQAVRASGVGDLRLVAAVVPETDGTMSVITARELGDGSALP